MCIIIDTNCTASVFKPSSQNHVEFKPILDWIIEGKGKIIIGGSDYKRENQGYLGLFSELSKINKVTSIPDEIVDKETNKYRTLINHQDYDDPHILALLKISKCKLICSLDERAYKYFKDKKLIQCEVPKIYNQAKNASLLNDLNIASICLPCQKVKKQVQESIKLK